MRTKPEITMGFIQNELRRKDVFTFPAKVGVGVID